MSGLYEAQLSALSPGSRALWGKSGDGTVWLSLAQHLLDTACVAERIWDDWLPYATQQRIARLTGLSPDDARTLTVWLAGVHDIGKAIMTFQSMLEHNELYSGLTARIRDAGLPLSKSSIETSMKKFRHELASGIVVEEWLLGQGVKRRIARSLAAVVDSHHGIPSPPALRSTARDVLAEYPEAWRAAHQEMLDWMAEAAQIHSVLPAIDKKLTALSQTLLCGIVIMADWIASGEEAFPLGVVDDQRARVDFGVSEALLTTPWEPELPDVHDLPALMRHRFGWSDELNPRPVQRATAELCAAADGASLLIIEAPTGEGKTEAALLAAEILAAKTGAGGAFVAAPTMATANGLFSRVSEWSARAVESGRAVSMYLGHSKNQLFKAYQDLRLHGIGFDAGDTADHGAVIAADWMSGRKKGILADFTVCTVDQVLAMALQAKHSMLRHLGVANKVVIIDEVHAYDAYMSQYLHQALAWLARYGVPVVLLSATLPRAQKQQLIHAYQAQLDRSAPTTPQVSTAYPLLTIANAQGIQEVAVPPRPADLHATVDIINDDLDTLENTLCNLLSDGGCALVLCNTVRRAQAAYESLSALFPDEVELHHAAFMAVDRSRKEERLHAELGPTAHRGSGRPDRRVLVATQVAEQSLDIDVDLLVTDIAPMDLLLQRVGRLHRHARPLEDRPEALRGPRVLIRAVEQSDPLPEFEKGTAFIYGQKLLMSTLSILRSQVVPNGLTRPDDISPLVQKTYSDAPPLPASWAQLWEEACAEDSSKRSRAEARAGTFLFPDPGVASTLDDLFNASISDAAAKRSEEEGFAQVRDAQPTIEVIPIVRTGDGAYQPLPWVGAGDTCLFDEMPPPAHIARLLAGCTVRLPAQFGRGDLFEAALGQLEEETPSGWKEAPFLRGQVALVLDANHQTTLAKRQLLYDEHMGLRDLALFVRPQV